MSLLPEVDAAEVSIKLAIIGAVVLVVVALAWRCSALSDDLAAERRETARLSGEVSKADLVLMQDKRTNDAMRDTILRLNAENVANADRAAKLEAEARTARQRLASSQAAARADDTARRARLDKPTAAEMNTVLRGVVGAM